MNIAQILVIEGIPIFRISCRLPYSFWPIKILTGKIPTTLRPYTIIQ